jgi:hypothetical protein
MVNQMPTNIATQLFYIDIVIRIGYWLHIISRPLHTIAKGREVVGFYQSDCKKPRIWPLNSSHWRSKLKGHRFLKCLHGNTFLSRWRTLEESLGLIGMESRTIVESSSNCFHKFLQKLTRSCPLDWRGCFGHVIKWDAPCSFGLGHWRLHTMPKRMFQFLYFISYFQAISSNSQQSLAI